LLLEALHKHFLMRDFMIDSSNSKAVQPRKQMAQCQAPRKIRQRPRDTRAAVAVHEGSTEADWQLWEDSVVAFESQFQAMKDQFAHVDAYAGEYQER
jgi:hypothetical protein